MTKIKFCGLKRECDILWANELKPDYIGFVFFEKSKRYVAPEKAKELKYLLDKSILATGVFVNEKIDVVCYLLSIGVIDIAQLHGEEDIAYITEVKKRTGKPVIRAFRIVSDKDIEAINNCPADYVLLDSGAGTGTVFDWSLIKRINRPYFLAGGLNITNASLAIEQLHPYALDVSSGIETDGLKDKSKMTAFMNAAGKDILI